ncbi:MAG: amidohydrolase, partial [Proteobacteria bacterium]|nr:amidohydrolase [Pseudomonadota bacterium]
MMKSKAALIFHAGLMAALLLPTALNAQEEDDSGVPMPLVEYNKNPYPGTYKPLPSRPTLITNVTILDGRGGRIDAGSVLMSGGEIVAIGADLTAPEGATVIDGTGKWVTPGIIDVHSHLGDYPTPAVSAHSDGN